MRNRLGGIWLLFIFFFIFGFSGFLPLLITFGIAAFVMYLAVKSSRDNEFTETSAGSRRQKVNRYGMADTRHSAASKAKVNAYLLKRFRNGDRAISLTSGNHNIVLTMADGKFSSLDSLEVDCDGHYFKTVGDFRREYSEIYDQMFDSLLTMEANDVAVQKPDIVDVEYVPKTEPIRQKKPAAGPKAGQNSSSEKQKETVQPHDAASFREVINSLNDGIPDDEISNSLYETSALLKQLSDLERAFPGQTGKLKKLYSNYLPYLVGILQQYTKMQHVQTDSNYEQNVESLKNTIRHLNSAMKDRLIPAMSENDSINLSADMSTLDAMLRKDGMTADDDIMMALKAQQRSESEESGKQV